MKPKVILGDFTGRREPRLEELGWGRMKIDRSFTPRGKHGGQWMHYKGEPWALDNGAFIQWSRQGKPIGSGEYDFSSFEARLDELDRHMSWDPCRSPLFVVVPDLPAQGLESLCFSLDWIHKTMADHPESRWIYRFYLAVQDGMDPAHLQLECHECGEPVAEHFAGIFLGGSDQFKRETALAWSAHAKAHGLKFHYARAGTIEKMKHAHLVGADSLDSAFPMFLSSRWTAFEDAWLELEKLPFEKGVSDGQLHLWS